MTMTECRSLFTTVAATVILAMASTVWAASRNPAAADVKMSSVQVQKKKKGLPKKNDYSLWAEAAAAAASWEQPVVVFLDLEDSKSCRRVRGATVGHKLFKEFMTDNCVCYRYKVPKVVVKRRRRGRANPSDEMPRPDFGAVKKSERGMVESITKNKKTFGFPGVALFRPNGRCIGLIVCDESEITFDKFIDELEGLFKKGKYEFTVSKTIQKHIAAERKKRAALEKRRKK